MSLNLEVIGRPIRSQPFPYMLRTINQDGRTVLGNAVAEIITAEEID
jgi:hypothetical protein